MLVIGIFILLSFGGQFEIFYINSDHVTNPAIEYQNCLCDSVRCRTKLLMLSLSDIKQLFDTYPVKRISN